MSKAAAQQYTIELVGTVVGPDDWLILCPRQHLDAGEALRLQETLPVALHGRVMLVADMDAYVITQRR